MVILVTGGAGFIGSHTCVELLEHGHEVVVVDNYSNSSPAALEELQRLAGRPLVAYELDLRDHTRAALTRNGAGGPPRTSRRCAATLGDSSGSIRMATADSGTAQMR